MFLLTRLIKWWQTNPDALLLAALEKNKYKYRPGMEKPDRDIITRLGQNRWEEVVKAQEKKRVT
jgi:hypothetical protein